jgi:predicted 3-demethylubiquinone-9 3-methyltransferase (glyoxalase superfamily)
VSALPIESNSTMAKEISTFLMLEGTAEEAMRAYTSLFADSAITSIKRYGPGEPGAEGSVMHASFTLRGRSFMAIDSPARHAFGMTPAVSLFVDCESEEEIDRLFAALSRDGKIMMPLDRYPFAEKFAWVADRFGLSWQLSLGRSV